VGPAASGPSPKGWLAERKKEKKPEGSRHADELIEAVPRAAPPEEALPVNVPRASRTCGAASSQRHKPRLPRRDSGNASPRSRNPLRRTGAAKERDSASQTDRQRCLGVVGGAFLTSQPHPLRPEHRGNEPPVGYKRGARLLFAPNVLLLTPRGGYSALFPHSFIILPHSDASSAEICLRAREVMILGYRVGANTSHRFLRPGAQPEPRMDLPPSKPRFETGETFKTSPPRRPTLIGAGGPTAACAPRRTDGAVRRGRTWPALSRRCATPWGW